MSTVVQYGYKSDSTGEVRWADSDGDLPAAESHPTMSWLRGTSGPHYRADSKGVSIQDLLDGAADNNAELVQRLITTSEPEPVLSPLERYPSGKLVNITGTVVGSGAEYNTDGTLEAITVTVEVQL